MTNARHETSKTLGPFTIEAYTAQRRVWRKDISETYWAVMDNQEIVYSFTPGNAEEVARANLIAAAPELLAALRIAASVLSRQDYKQVHMQARDIVEQAIAKAEGR